MKKDFPIDIAVARLEKEVRDYQVPVVDLVAVVEKPTTTEGLNAALKKAAEGPLKGILEFCEEDLVSVAPVVIQKTVKQNDQSKPEMVTKLALKREQSLKEGDTIHISGKNIFTVVIGRTEDNGSRRNPITPDCAAC